MTSVTRTVVVVGAPATSIRTDLDLELIEEIKQSLACEMEGHSQAPLDGYGCVPSQPASWVGATPCPCPPVLMCDGAKHRWVSWRDAHASTFAICETCAGRFKIGLLTFYPI